MSQHDITLKPKSLARRLVLCAIACLLFALAPSKASAGLLFDVTLDTTSLISHPAGPFAIDFQFNDGSGTSDANNVVSIGNFTFGGGSPLGTPTLIGGASGELSSSLVEIIDSSFRNEFTQSFTAGTQLSFRVNLSLHSEADLSQDEFTFAILDSSGIEIPTLDPGGRNVILLVDLDPDHPLLQTFGGDRSFTPTAGGDGIGFDAPSVELVPAPPSFFLAAMAIVLRLGSAKRLRATLRGRRCQRWFSLSHQK